MESLEILIPGLLIIGFGVLWLRDPGIIGKVPWWPDNELLEHATTMTGYVIGGMFVLFGVAVVFFALL